MTISTMPKMAGKIPPAGHSVPRRFGEERPGQVRRAVADDVEQDHRQDREHDQQRRARRDRQRPSARKLRARAARRLRRAMRSIVRGGGRGFGRRGHVALPRLPLHAADRPVAERC